MAKMKTNGFRQPVTICDEDGNQVGIIFDGTVFRLAVDATISGPIFIGEVELKDSETTTEASIKQDGVAIAVGDDGGGLLVSGRDPLDKQRQFRTTTAGVIKTNGTPTATITTAANTPVVGLAVALPVPPAGTKRMRVQNVGGAGSRMRVREVGGPAGTGVQITRFGVQSFGGADGSIAALEADAVVGAPVAAIIFEIE